MSNSIIVNQNVDGSYTIPSVQLVPASAAQPISPPPPPPPSTASGVTVTGTLADGTAISIALAPGQRVPLVAGKLVGSAVFHADGLSVCIENCYAGTVADLAGTFTIMAGATQLFSGPLTIWCYSRTRPFWLSQPVANPTPDFSMFAKLGAAPTASMVTQYAKADNSPMGIGLACPAMGTTGERPDLGPVPQWDACYLTNPSAANAGVVRGMSDAASPWPFHVIDPATNKMLSTSQWPKATMLDVSRGTAGNPIVPFTTACTLSLEQAMAHGPAFSAVACALFGTAYDREELALWANYANALWTGYRSSAGCVPCLHCQVRALARGLTTLIYAAKLSDSQDYFNAWLPAIAADYNTNYLSQTGVQVPQVGYGIDGQSGRYAPWQQSLFIFAIGLALQNGHAEFQQVFDYFMPPMLDSMLVAQHEFSTLYQCTAWDANKVVAADWKTVLADTALTDAKVAAALPLAEDSVALQFALGNAVPPYQGGDYSGYPWAADGYAAVAQGGFAMAARYATDQARAQAAWTKFKQYARCDYSQNPKYNVIP